MTLDYLKPLMHILCSPLSLPSFLFDPTKIYLSRSIPNPSFPESQGDISFKEGGGGGGVVCHIPKFPIRNVNHFSKRNSNFQKGFIYFHLNGFL
jgi:hypothetical protein